VPIILEHHLSPLEPAMALDIFLNLGDKITGESQDAAQGPKGDMDVLSWRWGASNAGSFHAGGGGGAGKANFNDILITRHVDKASPALLNALARGSHIPLAKILMRKAGEGQQKYLEIQMRKVLVTSISSGAFGHELRLVENITLNFAAIHFEYFVQNEKGVTASAGVFNWDIAGNVAV